METLAITGGLGFIGTNLVPCLSSRLGVKIRILDNLSNPSGDLVISDEIEVIEGDLQDARKVNQLVEGADAVVHLAAHTRVIESIEDPITNFKVNVQGTFNILEAMRQNKTPRIVNASTGGAILGEVQPPINEDIAAKPASAYGASKLAAEGYCSAYAKSYGIMAASLRFSNIYGPHSINKGSVIAAFLKAIDDPNGVVVYGDGSQTRDYLYVGDLVDGIIQALQKNAVGVYQLGGGTPTDLNHLVSIINNVTGKELPVKYEHFRAGEIVHTYCDINKAKHELDFNPKVDLESGIMKTWKWLQSYN